jgi:hypothetical protein
MIASMDIFNKDCIIIILKYGPSTKHNGTSSLIMNKTNFFSIFLLEGIIVGVKKTLPKKKEMVDRVGLNLFFATCLSPSRPYFSHSIHSFQSC